MESLTKETMAFLWNVMDRKTRYLLASKLSSHRDDIGAFQAFKEARNNSHGQFPEKIFTDSDKRYENIGVLYVKELRYKEVGNQWNPKLPKVKGSTTTLSSLTKH